MTTWPEILDDIEKRNEGCRKFLENGSGSVPVFLPPAEVGPLPPEFQERAKALLEESRALEARISDMKDSVAGLLIPRTAGYELTPFAFLDELA